MLIRIGYRYDTDNCTILKYQCFIATMTRLACWAFELPPNRDGWRAEILCGVVPKSKDTATNGEELRSNTKPFPYEIMRDKS